MVVFSCSSVKKVAGSTDSNALYLVKSIEKKNLWYVVYLEKQDTLYKVVSKVNRSDNNCKKIIAGRRYNFNLKSHRENAPTINNVKLDPVGYTGCYQFDEETAICLEPKNGIFDLFITENLKGICYIK